MNFGYIVKRVLSMIPVLVALIVLTFIVSAAIPVDPARLIIGESSIPTEEQIAQIRRELGLDQPLPVRFFSYIKGILRGDLGKSFVTRRNVADDVRKYFMATFELTTLALIISLAIGIPMGVISAVKRNNIVDHVSRVFSMIGVSTPSYWLALVLQIVLYYQLGLFPVGQRLSQSMELYNPIRTITGLYTFDALITGNFAGLADALWHMALPAVVLSFPTLALVSRMTRSSMLDTIEKSYILTARAYGFKERVIIFKYALKSAFIPIATVIGLSYGILLHGSVIVESVFGWPGIGQYTYKSLIMLDYPAIAGAVLVGCVVYSILNLLVDISYSLLDPRIRF